MKKTIDIIKEQLINRNLAPIKGVRGLGGDRHKQRGDALKQGRQKRTPALYTEDATKKVMQKLKKQNGKTDTGQAADTVNFEPNKPELTTNH